MFVSDEKSCSFVCFSCLFIVNGWVGEWKAIHGPRRKRKESSSRGTFDDRTIVGNSTQGMFDVLGRKSLLIRSGYPLSSDRSSLRPDTRAIEINRCSSVEALSDAIRKIFDEEWLASSSFHSPIGISFNAVKRDKSILFSPGHVNQRSNRRRQFSKCFAIKNPWLVWMAFVLLCAFEQHPSFAAFNANRFQWWTHSHA